ncbi:Esterase/lipase-like protein [Novosphingobium aromaticivorans DSM 12444]|uniref:Esterase/lipase-like protein n=1 Tax=Novosphingobium aromaticivorans (strain ATCC 700278 / DSM 12444 / CCUG 56034 / CIP 105152 / NBRC 16084 / F199) TaxID=279238 RepID=Q2GA90_NOVAD|nr:alpha/beta hydrolase [Novosphingobium aromaticivorans]ABD25233.1 Esterase/lipase-like protein [Novosphingobium aromaticivorans DSM 12444]SCX87450.1 Acetyl esterase/lipase [Novosphingobium aromaticivorans]
MTLPALRRSLLGLSLALLTSSNTLAQTGISTETVDAPAQPNTITLPTAEKVDREVWHPSDLGRVAVRNVTRPTLTVFQPVGKPSPASVIIAPGGAFLGLEMDKEGWEVARWFANHGVTAFVLKYRTLPTPPDQKVFVAELDKMIAGKTAAFAPPADTPPEALADGIAALRHVRASAVTYGIDPQRVGFMGFSAGGFLTRSVVERGGVDRPDFAAPIYPNMAAMTVPADAPPMFVAIAADDFLLARQQGVPLLDSYRAAGKSIEFHLFSAGGHGFGAGPDDSPEEGWMELMYRWMRTQGLLQTEKK